MMFGHLCRQDLPQLLLLQVFDCPLVTFSPAGPFPQFLYGTGNIINLSVQPLVQGNNKSIVNEFDFDLLSARYIEPMTFTERISNHFFSWFSETFSRYIDKWGKDARIKALGHEVLSTEEMVE